MRVSSINTVMYSNNCKPRCQRSLHSEEPQNNTSFQGVKGGAKGGALGALAALGVAALAGPFGLAVLPLWTVGGAIAGHGYEEENKPEPPEDDKTKTQV